MAKNIHTKDVTEAVKKMCIEANYYLDEDMIRAFDRALETETSDTGRTVLRLLKENAQIAAAEEVPYCQDTGFAIFFVEVGQEINFSGGSLTEAINEGVRQGYEEGYLRKSICDPFTRENTKDNTPAVIHYEIVEGDELKIMLTAKGGGSENMSRCTMLRPADGVEGIKKFVLQRCEEMGPNPCPPVVVGIGIGGSFEKAALLAKKSLFRPVGTRNPDPELAAIEEELLESINDLGVGPQGFGGRNFALGVHILKHPCHIASLPLAVNIQCHANRHREVAL